LGENSRRIFALSVWHESHLFTIEERAILQLTEEVTRIYEKGISDETYNNVVRLFGEKITAQIIMLIVTINAWNRIAVSTKKIYKQRTNHEVYHTEAIIRNIKQNDEENR